MVKGCILSRPVTYPRCITSLWPPKAIAVTVIGRRLYGLFVKFAVSLLCKRMPWSDCVALNWALLEWWLKFGEKHNACPHACARMAAFAALRRLVSVVMTWHEVSEEQHVTVQDE